MSEGYQAIGINHLQHTDTLMFSHFSSPDTKAVSVILPVWLIKIPNSAMSGLRAS